MSCRIKIIDGKIRGVIAAGRQQPDYKDIFPDIAMPEDLLDEYGNGQYELKVTDGKDGKKVEVVHSPMMPTQEQKDKVYKQKVVSEIRKKYSVDDEIALLFHGKAEDIQEHENHVESVKISARAELDSK